MALQDRLASGDRAGGARDETVKPRRAHTCANCAFFDAPSGDREKILKIGGAWRGDCLLSPTAVKKTPEEFCAAHSAVAAELQAQGAAATVAALVPVIEKGFAALGQALLAATTGAKR